MLTNLQSGKYEIIRELAQGGMGKIYLAKHTTLNRNVAIKALHQQFSSDEAFIERFLREARAMAQLDHPNIISVYDVFEDKGSYYIVMEFCPGQSLEAKIKSSGTLTAKYTLDVAIQVARGLHYAHEREIIHRDIKPANIMVEDNGRVKLTDFGIAAAKNLSGLTATGQVIGSPQYMSPEQASGAELDGRSDLYSLGMVMYKMLSGKTPLEGHSLISIMGKLVYQAEDLEYLYPEAVPKAVADLINQLVHRDPEKRVDSADHLIDIIQSVIENPNKPATQRNTRGEDATEFLSAREARALIAERQQQANRPASPRAAAPHTPTHGIISKLWQPKLLIAGGITAVIAVGGLTLYLVTDHSTGNGKSPDPVATAVPAKPQAPAKPDEQLLKLKTSVTQLTEAIDGMFQEADKVVRDDLLKPQLRTSGELESKGLELYQRAETAFTAQQYAQAEPLYRDAQSFLSQARDQYENLMRTATLVSDISFLRAEVNSLASLFDVVAANHKSANDVAAERYAPALFNTGASAEKDGLATLDSSRKAEKNGHLQDAKKLLAQARRLAEQANLAFKDATANAETASLSERLARLKKDALDASANVTKARDSARESGAPTYASARYSEASAQESRAQAQLMEAERLYDAGRMTQAVTPYSQAIALFTTSQRDYRNAANDAQATRDQRAAANRAASEKSDQDIVSARLLDFKRAYGDKDLAELESLTQMSQRRRDFLERLFSSYDAIQISISSFAINATGNSAQAVIRIDKLANKSGDQVIPGDSWKDAKVELEKQGDNWGKIQW